MKTLALNNVNVILPDRDLKNSSVMLAGEKIIEVSTRPRLKGDVEIDLAGTQLLPGFIDVHLHGAVDVDVMEATPAELRRISEFLASQGVTSWVPTFVPAAGEKYGSAVKAIGQSMEDTEAGGARVVGVHYEGPFVNSSQCGALHVENFRTYSGPADLDCLPTPGVTGSVCMITLAPEIDGGVKLVRDLKARGWVISIGHTRADPKTLDLATEAGARHMTHFMNAMPPMHHRNPGPVAWGLALTDVTCDVIADGIHLDPFVLALLLKVKGARGLMLISDAIAATGKGDGEYHIWGETITVKNGRTSNSSGSIAGSVITMLDAVRLMRSLGASYVELARMASLNPAELLGLDNECGSIEVGKRADLVALDENGAVRLTLVGGNVAFRT